MVKANFGNKHAKVAKHIARRLFQIFVTWPGQALGGLAVAVAVLGGSPIHDAVVGIYSWADAAVRNAPAGLVLNYECARRSASEPVDCKRSGVSRAVPVADAIQTTEDTVFGVYQGLVLVCATIMVITMGWREFVGLPVETKQGVSGTK